MEVIYTGLHQTPEQIVETAIQEDADAVGVSILSGRAHDARTRESSTGSRANGADDVLVVVGGTIPPDDADELKARGVAAVFGPGANDRRDRRLPARRRRRLAPSAYGASGVTRLTARAPGAPASASLVTSAFAVNTATRDDSLGTACRGAPASAGSTP